VTEPEFVRAIRASYDVIAEDYATRFRGELEAKPFERAVLSAFAETVRAAGGGPVADVGCGTGRVTGFLHSQGLDVSGIDLSPGMLAIARRTYPHIAFNTGSMLALDLPSASLRGLVAWYSVIHVPGELLPGVFGGFARALAPGGHLLVAFQAGDDVRHLSAHNGHEIDLDFRRLQPDNVAGLLADAGMQVRARLVREPDDEGEFTELSPQAFLIARKPRLPSPRASAGTGQAE
jgi:SAM-dependent methyltransferase